MNTNSNCSSLPGPSADRSTRSVRSAIPSDVKSPPVSPLAAFQGSSSRRAWIGHLLSGSAPGFRPRLPDEDGPPPSVIFLGSGLLATGVGAGASATFTSEPSPQPRARVNANAPSIDRPTMFFNRIDSSSGSQELIRSGVFRPARKRTTHETILPPQTLYQVSPDNTPV